VKVSDYVMQYLRDVVGVTKVFTVSGGGCMHLIDSLSKTSGMEYICCHHEQAAAMAAEGYARMTGDLGVVLVTTGPGGVNALNGVLGTWLDSVPMLVISGQVSLNQTVGDSGCRQIGDQEFAIVPMVQHMTKYAAMVTNKDEIGTVLRDAVHIAKSDRPGPVWIDIPLNIQAADTDGRIDGSVDDRKVCNVFSREHQKLTELLKDSKNPLIVVGNGVRLSGGQDLLRSLSAKYMLPVMTNCHSAVDLVNESDPYYCGRYGILGQRSSNTIIQECDLLIAIGTRLTMKTTGYNVRDFAKNAKKVVVDVDESETNKHSFPIDLKICSDAKLFLLKFSKLVSELGKKGEDEWLTRCRGLREKDVFVQPKHHEMVNYVSVYHFIDRLSDYLRERGNRVPVVLTNGSAHVITHHAMRMYGDQRVFTNVGCASMGYGLPAAIGACIANNREDVICIEGDGSIMMNLQELQTVVGYKLPLKIFVINNRGYSSIKQTQKTFFNGHLAASSPETGVTLPDFCSVADAFGIRTCSVSRNEGINEVLSFMLDEPGPCLCEIYAHPNEPFEPKVVPKGVDANGKIIPGDLTNMSTTEGFENP
jgi:acetolactate synthase I/II/III large subunit